MAQVAVNKFGGESIFNDKPYRKDGLWKMKK